MARTYSFFGEVVKGVARETEEEVDALDGDLKRVVGWLRMDGLLAGSAVLIDSFEWIPRADDRDNRDI